MGGRGPLPGEPLTQWHTDSTRSPNRRTRSGSRVCCPQRDNSISIPGADASREPAGRRALHAALWTRRVTWWPRQRQEGAPRGRSLGDAETPAQAHAAGEQSQQDRDSARVPLSRRGFLSRGGSPPPSLAPPCSGRAWANVLSFPGWEPLKVKPYLSLYLQCLVWSPAAYVRLCARGEG